MNEFQVELVKEIQSEAKKSKQTIDWAFERLEKLCDKLLKESEEKNATGLAIPK